MREKAAVVPTRGDVSPAGGSEVGEVTEELLRQGVGRRNDGFSWLKHTAGDKGVLRAADNSLRAGPMSGGAQITGEIAAATGAGGGAADTPCGTMPQPWPVGRQILASGGSSGCVACSANAAAPLAPLVLVDRRRPACPLRCAACIAICTVFPAEWVPACAGPEMPPMGSLCREPWAPVHPRGLRSESPPETGGSRTAFLRNLLPHWAADLLFAATRAARSGAAARLPTRRRRVAVASALLLLRPARPWPDPRIPRSARTPSVPRPCPDPAPHRLPPSPLRPGPGPAPPATHCHGPPATPHPTSFSGARPTSHARRQGRRPHPPSRAVLGLSWRPTALAHSPPVRQAAPSANPTPHGRAIRRAASPPGLYSPWLRHVAPWSVFCVCFYLLYLLYLLCLVLCFLLCWILVSGQTLVVYTFSDFHTPSPHPVHLDLNTGTPSRKLQRQQVARPSEPTRAPGRL